MTNTGIKTRFVVGYMAALAVVAAIGLTPAQAREDYTTHRAEAVTVYAAEAGRVTLETRRGQLYDVEIDGEQPQPGERWTVTRIDPGTPRDPTDDIITDARPA
jgi:hypothetical protein